MQQLTDKQQLTLDFIQRYIAIHTVAPKLQEIAEGIGISSRGVAHRYVQALIDSGFITMDNGKHRGIRLRKPNTYRADSILPLLGKIAAGKPIEAIPGEDQIDLRDFFGHNNFAVRVQGDSMIEAGIMDGDTVIIEFRETANDGDIVVALIEDHAIDSQLPCSLHLEVEAPGKYRLPGCQAFARLLLVMGMQCVANIAVQAA